VKALVTGSSGFISFHLINELVKRRYEIRATGRKESDRSHLSVEFVPSDILDREDLKRVMEGIDIVFHLAAVFDFSAERSLMERVNVDGTRNICEVALDSDVKKFIHFSTCAVYGRPRKLPVNEEHPKNPSHPYEVTKWRSERVAFSFHQENGLPVVALRPGMVYGERNRYGHAVFIAILSILKRRFGWIPKLKDGPLGHHVHALDVASAAIFLSRKKSTIGNAYNIVDNNPISAGKFINLIAESLGLLCLGKLHLPKFQPWVFRLFPFFPANLGFLNDWLQNEWKRTIKIHKLEPALIPRIDKEWIYYAMDHYYDNRKIRKLGYKLRYPMVKEEIKNEIRWYKKEKWIP
jgi:nucleoside-diphosphate-sugar epimerase